MTQPSSHPTRGRDDALWQRAMPRITLVIAVFVLTWLVPVQVDAQGLSTIAGTVRDAAGQPVAGAVVLIFGTPERAITDSAGEFVLDAGDISSVALIVRRTGYRPVRRVLLLPLDRPVTVIMMVRPSAREPILHEAGTYRLGSIPGATLSDIEMIRTPGAAGDPFRAIQTLAGLQNVGDGAGLHVRGGAVSETRILVEGATILSPFRQESERTLSFGRFDPLHLHGIHFSVGGFSAEYGDALSAIADIEMAGKPIRNGLGLTASVAGLSGDVRFELSESAGVRLSAGHINTDLFLRMNGRREEFDEVPVSTDFSGAGEWIYSPSGSVKAFAFFQLDHVGVKTDFRAESGIYRQDARSNLLAVSGLDTFGDVRLSWGVTTSGSGNGSDFGALGALGDLSDVRIDRSDRITQARAKVEVPVRSGIVLAAGAEIEDRKMDTSGSGQVEIDLPGGPLISAFDFSNRASGTRLGGFGEFELQPSSALRFRLGLRSDRSSFTGRTTVDPRVSASFRPAGSLTLTAAWGVFHQVADPRLYEVVDPRLFGSILGGPTLPTLLIFPDLPAMSARHFIAGVTYHNGDRLIRAEVYHKLYMSLATPRLGFSPTQDGGRGEAAGFDVLVKEDLEILGLTGRVAYSFIRSERTALFTEELVPSPYDVTHTLNVVFNRSFGWLQMGVAYRVANGVPFTPVESAVYVEQLDLWLPEYGEPSSERLPVYSRLDLSVSAIRSLWRRNITVFFVSMMNALNHRNILTYRYNEDYSERLSPEARVPRTFFFGVTTTLPY